MGSFLASFSSEFRKFDRIPRTGNAKNTIGEVVKVDGSAVKIIGIIFEVKWAKPVVFENGLNYKNTYYKFFFEKWQTLNKDDYILDGDIKFKVIAKPKKIYVFNAIYDHNTADLQLVE